MNDGLFSSVKVTFIYLLNVQTQISNAVHTQVMVCDGTTAVKVGFGAQTIPYPSCLIRVNITACFSFCHLERGVLQCFVFLTNRLCGFDDLMKSLENVTSFGAWFCK